MKLPPAFDYGLYFGIAFLTTWQAFRFEVNKEAIGSSCLAGLVALKAKRSGNGKQEDTK